MARPRKYASDAERQAAYRARNFVMTFRVSAETAAAIERRAAGLGDMDRSEWILRAVRWVLANKAPTDPLFTGALQRGRDFRGEALDKALRGVVIDADDLGEFLENPDHA